MRTLASTRPVGLALAVTIVLASCTSALNEPKIGASDPSGVSCDPGSAKPGETVHLQSEVDGVARTYWLHLPADYDCTPRPVVVGLHGYWGSGRGFEKGAGLADEIDERGYIGLYPDGLAMATDGWRAKVTSFNDIDSHNSRGPDGRTCSADAYDYGVYEGTSTQERKSHCHWGTSNADDEGFIRSLITEGTTSWAGDPERVHLMGFSQGGQTAQSLARRLSDVIVSAAPVHGFSANGYTEAPTTPMSLFQVWGTQDRTVDGHDRPSSDGMIYDGARETVEIWAWAQGCQPDPVRYRTPDDGTSGWDVVEYPNCRSGATVITGSWTGKHEWGTKGSTTFVLDAILDSFEPDDQ